MTKRHEVTARGRADRSRRGSGLQRLLCIAVVAWLIGLARGAAAQTAFHDAPQGYLRLDTNLKQNLFWLGGALPVSSALDMISDLILEGTTLQADVGAAIYTASLVVAPSLGVSFDFARAQRRFDRLVPRAISALEIGPVYAESWLQLTLRDQFRGGALDTFYTRDFILFVTRYISVGPQFELTHALKNIPGADMLNCALGGQLATRWGLSRFALFVGYDLAKPARDVVGRFTFVRTWQ